MATTNISIRSKDQSGTTGTTTINYVNPEATSSQLQSLASAFNDLTTNEIVDVTRIDKQVLGSEIGKLSRNLKFVRVTAPDTAVTTLTAADLPTSEENNYYSLKYDGAQPTDQVFICYDNPEEKGNLYFDLWDTPTTSGGGLNLYFKKGTDGTIDFTGTKLIFYLPETDTYAAATVEVTLTD